MCLPATQFNAGKRLREAKNKKNAKRFAQEHSLHVLGRCSVRQAGRVHHTWEGKESVIGLPAGVAAECTLPVLGRCKVRETRRVYHTWEGRECETRPPVGVCRNGNNDHHESAQGGRITTTGRSIKFRGHRIYHPPLSFSLFRRENLFSPRAIRFFL